MDGMSQEQMACMGSFTPAQTDNMNFAFEGASETWKSEAFVNKVRQTSSGASMSFPPLLEAAATAPPMEPMMDSNILHDTAQSTPKDAPLDERVESIMQHVQAVGFDSFDDLATAYYSSTFRDTSPLANEQHLSRNRRLPKVLSDVYQATDNWSHWERRGFHEEILKTAESMLTSEASTTRDSLLVQIGSLMDMQDVNNSPQTAESLQSMKRSIQYQVSSITRTRHTVDRLLTC